MLKQARPFDSLEAEVLIGLQITAQRIMEPWIAYLKQHAGLTPNQYNVLRILRGAHPEGLKCFEIGERMITRVPDVTRLTDRLISAGLVRRERDTTDRRRVTIYLTASGMEMLNSLDAAAAAMPAEILGHIGDRDLRRLRDILEEVVGRTDTEFDSKK
jgi:DNA-binding MarR family transcriptional regulator